MAESPANPRAEESATDVTDVTTWPTATLVVRGGQGKLEDLRDTLRQDGAFSVISRPDAEVDVLAASVRNNQIRTTTVNAVVSVRRASRPDVWGERTTKSL